MRPARRVLRVGLVVLSVASLVTAGGCGLTEDREPEVLAAEDLPPELLDPTPATTTTTPTGRSPVTIYLVEEQAGESLLTPIVRRVADPTDPASRLEALFGGPSDEERELGVSSSIPSDVSLLDWSGPGDDQELVIDLTEDIFDVESRELSRAFAQIVWTVTELETVGSVRFLVDGEPTNARDGEGGEQPVVTRADYRSLAPTANR